VGLIFVDIGAVVVDCAADVLCEIGVDGCGSASDVCEEAPPVGTFVWFGGTTWPFAP
jgi:hypothetical protein